MGLTIVSKCTIRVESLKDGILSAGQIIFIKLGGIISTNQRTILYVNALRAFFAKQLCALALLQNSLTARRLFASGAALKKESLAQMPRNRQHLAPPTEASAREGREQLRMHFLKRERYFLKMQAFILLSCSRVSICYICAYIK